MAFWIVLTSWISYRWSRSRPVLDGLPILVVRDGEVLEDALAVERLTVDELIEAARNNGIGDLNDVAFAVLEPDGKFSFVER